MSNIPEARSKLEGLKARHPIIALELQEVLNLMTRESAPRRTRKRLPPLTEQQIASIKQFAVLNPQMSQLDIAIRYGTNPGRVSEALNGKV
jgi:hypothetical protein